MNSKRIFQRVSCISGIALAFALGACRATEGTAVDDSIIATKVQQVLAVNSNLVRYPITVEVKDAKVTLNGRVDRSEQREAAERLVRNVVGVEGVSNRIVVAPAEAASTGADDLKSTEPGSARTGDAGDRPPSDRRY